MKRISTADATRAERQGGRSFMVLPLSKKQYEAWMAKLGGSHVGAVTVWREGDRWIRSLPRNGRWVLTYSRVPPRPGELLTPHPDQG